MANCAVARKTTGETERQDLGIAMQEGMVFLVQIPRLLPLFHTASPALLCHFSLIVEVLCPDLLDLDILLQTPYSPLAHHALACSAPRLFASCLDGYYSTPLLSLAKSRSYREPL
jgi:hypothetical protein